MNKRKIGNIVCFVISLFILAIGISLGRFTLLNGVFGIDNDITAGIELFGVMFSLAFLIIAGIIVLFGILLAVIALNLGKDNKKEEKQDKNVIQEADTKNNLLVKIEIIIYIIWIGLYIFIGG